LRCTMFSSVQEIQVLPADSRLVIWGPGAGRHELRGRVLIRVVDGHEGLHLGYAGARRG
jgi:hypothetical protein